MAEKESEETTVVSTEEASEGTSEGTEEKQFTCSLCGTSVVPEEVDTPTGVRYKCPECKKFMKPLTSKEVREEEERGPLPPLEVRVTERVEELLMKELPRVYGIPKKDMNKTITAIIDTLTPAQATDPWNLHSHIKDFASNANDRHLESVINKIFYQLEEEGYISRDQEYQPRYGARQGGYQPRGYQPRYAPPRAIEGIQGYYSDYEDYVPRRRPMKVVVDGQEITTDLEGYMAYQRYKREQSEEKRRADEHDLVMKRLEAEIKEITERTGSKGSGETSVPIKVGDKEVSVPVSVAPLYLGESEELKSLRQEVKDLGEKLHSQEMGGLKEDLADLKDKIESRPTFLEELTAYRKYGEQLGLKATGRTTIDVLSSLGESFDKRAGQLLEKLPGPGAVFKPEVTRTPEERMERAEEIKGRLEKSEEILGAEDELVRAASKVKSS